MVEEVQSKTHAWKVMMFLSIVFILWTVFVITRGTEILPTAFELAGSPQLMEDIEKSARDFMHMTMLKPLWEGLWLGIFGLLIAFGMKRKMRFAWTLGFFWGIMMLSNATIQGGYELFVLGWSKVCLQTYVFLVLGLVALITLAVSKKQFTPKQTQQKS